MAGVADSVPFNKDRMFDKFKDGSFIAKMVEILESGKQQKEVKLSGIHRNPRKLKLFWTENLRISWNYMRKECKIDLNAVNYQSVMNGHPGTILALIWRWIQIYDIADGVKELLRWVQAHTGTHITVTDFTNSWKDGIAFVELYSNLFSCVEEVSVDEWKGKGVEERMEWAWEAFQNRLGVSKMLEVQDFQVTNINSSQVQTYIAAIRTEYEKWHAQWQAEQDDDAERERLRLLEEERFRQMQIDEEERRRILREKEAKEEEERKRRESEKHEKEGDRFFNLGWQAFTNQKSETNVVVTEIVNEITEQLSTAEDPVNYSEFTQMAKEKFRDRTPGFDVSIEKFTNAKDEYEQVTHTDVTEKKDKCDKMIVEVNEYRDQFDVEIEEALEEKYQVDRADRFYYTTVEHMETLISEGGMELHEIIEETETTMIQISDRMPVCDTREDFDRERAKIEDELIRIEKEAIDRVENWVTIFDPLKPEFAQAEDMYPDNHEGKQKCGDKQVEIDTTITEFKELMHMRVRKAIEDALPKPPEDVVFVDDLLQLYHDTSVVNNATVGGTEDATLDELLNDPTKCKERLNDIEERVLGVWGDSESLRKKVHDQIDATFNENGYQCKDGTDCCLDCKHGR
jgi:hypothetical protein